MTIKLHCFGESGNAYKAALALQLSGLDWEPVKVDFFGGETRTPDYRTTINNMGEAPVMIDGDIRLTQSGVIQDYISEQSGKFGGSNPEERREILRAVVDQVEGRVPVIMNTSFNLKGEPIVESPAHAFNTFSLSGMDLLFLNNYIIRADAKKQIAETRFHLRHEGDSVTQMVS